MLARLQPLTLKCFGPPRILVNGQEAGGDLTWRKHVGLLAYLALSPGCTRYREHLLGLLWPEVEESKARHSLNEAVRRLRAGLGAKRVLSRGDAVTLNDQSLTVDALGEALPDGDFLEGLTVPDAPAFEAWLAQQRRRFRDRRLDALLSEAERRLAASEYRAARALAHRALALDADAAEAVRLDMRASALCGDRSAALHAYRAFAERLALEYGDQPDRQLQALAERIRDARWRQASLTNTEAEPPLVGRAREHATAFTEVAAAFGNGGRVLVVTGPMGSGKTRLLAECANRWRLEGGAAALAHPLESDPGAPWCTLRQLMRGGLLDAPGLAATDPAALKMLASVVPRLAERFPPVSGLGHADVGDALGALLAAVADETPLALVLDNAHQADDETLSALQGAMLAASHRPVLLIVGMLESADGPAALVRLLGEIGRRLQGATVRLAPFTDQEVRALVDVLAPWCEGDEQRDRLARRVLFETAGDPFLAVSLLRGLTEVTSYREDALVWPVPNTTLETPVPFDVPHLVRATTLARLHGLTEQAKQVLVGSCLGDPDVDPAIVSGVTGLPPQAVDAGLVELERRHIVSFDGHRYYVEAALLREVILTELVTPGQRNQLEQRYDSARTALT